MLAPPHGPLTGRRATSTCRLLLNKLNRAD
jgi:hypothetical protein